MSHITPRIMPLKRIRSNAQPPPTPSFSCAFVPSVHPPSLFAFSSRRSSCHSLSPRFNLRPPSSRVFLPRFRTPAASLSDLPSQSQDVPEPILRAVEALSRQPRQTVQDIAATAGLPLDQAHLQAANLAALTNAPIDVTDKGDLAYRFPSNVRQLLRANSLRAQIRMTWDAIAPFVFTAARVAFGALLILSIVVTFVAIAALSSTARSNDDRRDRPSSMPVRFFAPDIFDIIWYTRRARYYEQPKLNQEMSFLEAVYSFVFGDPDPNQTLDSRRYRALAAIIRESNGAVTADQLAPYLDPPLKSDSTNVDETFILPVLQRFKGHPEVTEDGDIIYVFPEFGRTGTAIPRLEVAGTARLQPLSEIERPLTRATSGQRVMVVALGVVNILGVLTLGAKLVGAVPISVDAAAMLSFVKTVYPALAVYAASFVVIPLVRFFRLQKANKEIRLRNRARAAAAEAFARRGPDISRKLAAASTYSQKGGFVSSSDVIYSSDADLMEQEAVQDGLTDDFDRRLRER